MRDKIRSVFTIAAGRLLTPSLAWSHDWCVCVSTSCLPHQSSQSVVRRANSRNVKESKLYIYIYICIYIGARYLLVNYSSRLAYEWPTGSRECGTRARSRRRGYTMFLLCRSDERASKWMSWRWVMNNVVVQYSLVRVYFNENGLVCKRLFRRLLIWGMMKCYFCVSEFF